MVKLIKKDKSQKQIVTGIKDYALLNAALTKRGTFDRAYGYYFFLSLFVFVGFFVSAYFVIRINSTPLLIIMGVIFSFFAVQMAGLLHDAGHRAIFKTAKANDIFGIICGAFLAMGYNSWRLKHNKHHVHTNQEDEDPDVSLPLLSFTKERLSKKKGIAYYLRKYQAYLYYPMGVLVGFSVRTASFLYFIKNFSKKYVFELSLLIISLLIWFVVPLFFFSWQKYVLLFGVVNFTIGFYLLNVFAPNHKGMPQFAKNVKVSFLEQQIMTSRNIYPNWLTDFLYMGLNYQIEHHLFPNTPRNKLKQITPFVIALCKKRNMEFTQTTIIESNRIILSELQEIASAM